MVLSSARLHTRPGIVRSARRQDGNAPANRALLRGEQAFFEGNRVRIISVPRRGAGDMYGVQRVTSHERGEEIDFFARRRELIAPEP